MLVTSYKMASAEFLEQALSTDVDQNTVNAIVGSLENQLVTSLSSTCSQNIILNGVPNHLTNVLSRGNNIGVQKYNTDQISCSNIVTGIQSPAILTNSGFNNGQSFVSHTITGPASNSESLKLVYSQTQCLANPSNRVTFTAQSISNGCIGLPTSQSPLLHTVAGNTLIPQSVSKTVTMQPPLVIKQGTSSGQVGMQPGMVTVPMTVNSSMPGSIPNVMTLNKPGGQNVVVTTQNLGSAQPAIIPNVQILNMRPGAPAVAAQKSVATVSPRVVIGAPQVVGTRAAAPGITLQTLQSLQPGQQGHLLLKTETGQYQLLRVGPAPSAGALTAPQAQAIRLSAVPAHPGVATVSTSVAAPGQMAGQMPPGPVAPPVVAAPVVATPIVAPAPVSVSAGTPPPQPPTVTTQKPSDNTKEKCRNFLANLLDLSSKEPKSVEENVRNLIQELIDAQVEPEEFCDRLERLLNASPQPCLIGFLKRSLPLLRQSLVTKELVIEGINPPSPHIAFSTLTGPQPVLAGTNMQMLSDEEGSSPTLTPLVPAVLPLHSLMHSPQAFSGLSIQSAMQCPVASEMWCCQPRDEEPLSPTLTALMPSAVPVSVPAASNPVSVMPMQPSAPSQPKQQPGKPGGTIAVLQNIPVHTKLKVTNAKTMTVNSKSSFSRGQAPSAALSTVLTGKSLLKDKEKKSLLVAYSPHPFGDDKMAGDDDINDVAAMGGVNLAEESQRILGSTELIGTQIRSCKDEFLVPMGVMQAKLKAYVARKGMEEPSPEVAGLLSHAVHERLKSLVEKLSVIAQHRMDLVIKSDSRYEVTQDTKGQLKFLEELDRADKKRREDSEREMLLRAAKSRSKNEDPEQAKLKAKAKEMQRAELEELRQREANLTALQAIGPRKKPRLEAPGAAGDNVGNPSPHSNSGLTSRSQLALRTRLKRINHRDMIYLLEQERETSFSTLLYRSYLK